MEEPIYPTKTVSISILTGVKNGSVCTTSAGFVCYRLNGSMKRINHCCCLLNLDISILFLSKTINVFYFILTKGLIMKKNITFLVVLVIMTTLLIGTSSFPKVNEKDFLSTHKTLPYNPEEIFFEIEAPVDFTGPVELKDGRLFSVHRELIASCSSDGGRTWEDLGPLINQKGRGLRGNILRPQSIIRLQSGALAINYWERVGTGGMGLAHQCSYFIKSLDDGKTWSAPVQVNPSGTPSYATWMIQTNTGRLVLANEYFYGQPGDRDLGVCTCYYSDDEGKTWNESPEGLYVWEDYGAVIGSVEVPCIAETADGRLLMFMRTTLGRIAQSYSDDDGNHWQPVTLNDLVSSRSETWLTTISATGDLLCVWNQAATGEIRTGFYRGRLTSAVSRDSGKTWENFRTVAVSPGMENIARITDPEPPAYLRSGGTVPPRHLVSQEGFWMNRFPRVKFINDRAYLVYNHRIYTYPDSSEKWERVYNEYRLRVFPIEWFYKTDK